MRMWRREKTMQLKDKDEMAKNEKTANSIGMYDIAVGEQ